MSPLFYTKYSILLFICQVFCLFFYIGVYPILKIIKDWVESNSYQNPLPMSQKSGIAFPLIRRHPPASNSPNVAKELLLRRSANGQVKRILPLLSTRQIRFSLLLNNKKSNYSYFEVCHEDISNKTTQSPILFNKVAFCPQ